MAHPTINSLLAEVSSEAAKAYANGVRFFVAVETAKGEWIALHAEDQDHAARLGRCWVDEMGNRGASYWRLFDFGPAPKSFGHHFASFDWED